MENIKKNLQLLLKDDKIKDEQYKAKIKELDDNAHQLLLWTTISSILSYMILIVVIARIYVSFHGKNPVLLIGSLVTVYVLLCILVFATWKRITYKRSHFHIASKTYLNYQIYKLSGQRKLILFYLLEYTLLLVTAGVFFFMDVEHGLLILLKLTAPVSIINYVFGFYFIVNFTRQRKRFEVTNRQINQLIMANINQN